MPLAKPHPIFTSAEILRAIPAGKGVLQATIARRLGAENDGLLIGALLHQKERGALSYYYAQRGRIWFRT